VNPSEDAELEAKAPDLWAWSSRPEVTRRVVRESATDFLSELRQLVCLNFLNRVLRQSEEPFLHLDGTPQAGSYVIPPDAINTDETYRLKLDVCGVPYRHVARHKRPEVTMTMLGVVQLGLLAKGASLEGNHFVLDQMRIRVVNGQGQLLGRVKGRYSGEPARLPQADLMICVGANDDGNMPQSVIRGDAAPGTIVRATSGVKWENEQRVSHLWRASHHVVAV
jgi:hypothetical protein